MATTRQYELVYITPPETTDEVLADLHTQIAGIVERFGGTIASTEHWGRRKLAYEIDRHREGVYVLEVINAPGDLTAELDRRLRVTDTVIRHLIIRVDEELAVAERAQSRRKAAVAARRVRRGLPPEPEPAEADTDADENGEANDDAEGEDR